MTPHNHYLQALLLLGQWTADQWGLVTAAQARRDGLGHAQLRHLTRIGLLARVGHGIYLLTGAPLPMHLDAKVAWLRLDPATPAWQRRPGDPNCGVISHATACQLHGIGVLPIPRIEILTPRRRSTRDLSIHLRTALLRPEEITVVDGLPVTTPERTIIDLLRGRTDGGHVGDVVADAVQHQLVDIDSLADRVTPWAASYGLPRTAHGAELLTHLIAQTVIV